MDYLLLYLFIFIIVLLSILIFKHKFGKNLIPETEIRPLQSEDLITVAGLFNRLPHSPESFLTTVIKIEILKNWQV